MAGVAHLFPVDVYKTIGFGAVFSFSPSKEFLQRVDLGLTGGDVSVAGAMMEPVLNRQKARCPCGAQVSNTHTKRRRGSLWHYLILSVLHRPPVHIGFIPRSLQLSFKR